MNEVESILAKLSDPDMNVRWKAITVAEQQRDERVIGALVDRLRDPAPEVRAQAAQVLYWMYDERIAPGLIPLLTDRVPEVRIAATVGLSGRYYRQALEPLLDRLRDTEPEVRAATAKALSHYYSYQVVRHLVPMLEDASAEVRAAAARSLMEMDHRDAIQPLLELAMNDQEDSEVRRQAIESLGYLAHKGNMRPIDLLLDERDVVGRLLDLLDDEEEEIAQAVIEALERIGDQRAVVPLVAMLCNWYEDFGRRLWALGALGALKDFRVTPILIAALQDPKPMLRPFAASALGNLCDPAALPALDQLAGDEADQLGQAAAQAAANIRYELSWQEFDRVVEYLLGGDDQEQKRALECLSTWDEPRAMDLIVDSLCVAIERNDILLFMYAAKIVANAGEARALPWLARGAEFWGEKDFAGMVEEAEDAADYIRRKLNGEELEPYVSIGDEEEYELDDLDEEGDDLSYGNV